MKNSIFLLLLIFFIFSLVKTEKIKVKDSFYKQWLIGKYDPNQYPEFTFIPDSYTIPAPEKEYMIYGLALKFFMQMSDKAQQDNITLKAVSSLRNFTYQNNLWTPNYNERKDDPRFKTDYDIAVDIIQYLAMPTTSRHHWGTDIDINSVDPSYFDVEPGLSEYKWLQNNAAQFGFCQTFNSREIRQQGYQEEKWHWSFMPVSKGLYTNYKNFVTYNDIKGFDADETAEQIQIIPDYVLSINTECINFPAEQFGIEIEVVSDL